MRVFRTIAWSLLAIVVVLLGVVVTRAFLLGSSRQPYEPPLPIDHSIASTAAKHLGEAVRFETVSSGDSTNFDHALIALQDWMVRTYPKTMALTKEMFGRSVTLTWKGSDSLRPPLVLMAHQDVVPVEAGTEGGWAHHPFSGDVAGGYVWGRGTLDDKVNLVTELEAIEGLITSGFVPRRTIILVFGSNEESFGVGIKPIAEAWKQRGIRPWMVVDEGGAIVDGEVPTLKRPVALVGIAEKGYVSVELSAKSPGGHSSMPPRQTATGIVAAAVAELEENPMPPRFAAPLQESFAAVGPELGFPAKLVVANMWLFGGGARWYLTRRPETNAMVRTTGAATIFQSGVKENVLPERARAVVNYRILPGETVSQVLEHVRSVVKDERVDVRAMSAGTEPSPVSDVHSPQYQLLSSTIRAAMPDAIVSPYILLGGTDSRTFTSLTPFVFRFSPTRVSRADVARIHGTNERVSVDNLAEIVSFYQRLVRSADKS